MKIETYEEIKEKVSSFLQKMLPSLYHEESVKYRVLRQYVNVNNFQLNIIVEEQFYITIFILRNDFKYSDSHKEFHKMGNVYLNGVKWDMLEGNIFEGE